MVDSIAYIEEYMNDHNIENMTLYNDPEIIPKFGGFYPPKRAEDGKILCGKMKECKRFNVKLYSLVRNLRFLNFTNDRLHKDTLYAFCNITETVYKHMNNKLTQLNEYELFKIKYECMKYCKSVILFLGSLNKLLDQSRREKDFCFGACKHTERKQDHICIYSCGLSENEIVFMRKIQKLSNVLHNYYADINDVENIHICIYDIHDRSQLDENERRFLELSTKSDKSEYFEEYNELNKLFGNVYCLTSHELLPIKNVGNIREIYVNTLDILTKILNSIFGTNIEINRCVSNMCMDKLMLIQNDLSEPEKGAIANCKFEIKMT